MTEIIAFILGIFTQAAYAKGWLDTPIGYVKKTVKGWFA
jgi:hypothetical protein